MTPFACENSNKLNKHKCYYANVLVLIRWSGTFSSLSALSEYKYGLCSLVAPCRREVI